MKHTLAYFETRYFPMCLLHVTMYQYFIYNNLMTARGINILFGVSAESYSKHPLLFAFTWQLFFKENN